MHTESAPDVQQSQYNLSVLSANGPNRFHFVINVLFLPSKFNASKIFLTSQRPLKLTSGPVLWQFCLLTALFLGNRGHPNRQKKTGLPFHIIIICSVALGNFPLERPNRNLLKIVNNKAFRWWGASWIVRGENVGEKTRGDWGSSFPAIVSPRFFSSSIFRPSTTIRTPGTG